MICDCNSYCVVMLVIQSSQLVSIGYKLINYCQFKPITHCTIPVVLSMIVKMQNNHITTEIIKSESCTSVNPLQYVLYDCEYRYHVELIVELLVLHVENKRRQNMKRNILNSSVLGVVIFVVWAEVQQSNIMNHIIASIWIRYCTFVQHFK